MSALVICNLCERDYEQKHFNQKYCSDDCKHYAKKQAKLRYKKSEKGLATETRWRKSETRKESQKKYKQTQKEKMLSRNRAKIYRMTRGGNYSSWWRRESAMGCVNCGDKDDLCVDHKIPFHLSGDNSLDNLQVLCRSCNGVKGDRLWQK